MKREGLFIRTGTNEHFGVDIGTWSLQEEESTLSCEVEEDSFLVNGDVRLKSGGSSPLYRYLVDKLRHLSVCWVS